MLYAGCSRHAEQEEIFSWYQVIFDMLQWHRKYLSAEIHWKKPRAVMSLHFLLCSLRTMLEISPLKSLKDEKVCNYLEVTKRGLKRRWLWLVAP